MDQGKKLAEVTARLDAHDKRLSGLEADVKIVINDNNELKTELAVLQKMLERVDENTQSIKVSVDKGDAKWEDLKAQRDRDHLEEPRLRLNTMIDKILYTIIGAVVMYFLFQAFPFLQ